MTRKPVSFPSLTAESACAALREAGLDLAPAEIIVERREECWLVKLPRDQMAWLPASERGRERLARERRVLRLLAERCSFRTPRILYESEAGYDIRAAVVGRCNPWGLFEQVQSDAVLAKKLGAALGAILVEQHTRVARSDVEGWLPERLHWPESGDWIRERIVDVVDDGALQAAIGGAVATYEALVIDPADRVLVHADLGFHNVVVDPGTNEVRGVFDYEGAAWADRHHDFRYLVFAFPVEYVLESALAVYEPALGRRLSRQRIWLYNAVCAASFLAYRRGVPAEEHWCGRTLAEDLRWTRAALDHAATARDRAV